MSTLAILLASGTVGIGCGVGVAMLANRRVSKEKLAAARSEAQLVKNRAALEAKARSRSAATKARERALALQDKHDEMQRLAQIKIEAQAELLAQRESEFQEFDQDCTDRKDELREREATVKAAKDLTNNLRKNASALHKKRILQLEAVAQIHSSVLMEELRGTWLEQARADAAQLIREVEQSAGDSMHGREANRLMSVAVSRYQNHFLTERNISNIPLEGPVLDILTHNNNRILDALALGANTKLNLHETGESLRLEGLDGVGREVARRGIKALGRKPKSLAQAKENPEKWVTNIRGHLDAEIESLGKKAFKVLKVKIAHPEIVTLVGQLNYRTSYTQNQWLHAVEAAFLAGMMADEMGLDIVVARRATLMHDIGKALTHEIEGSHAVIGADIARRLKEDEIVANAIGSHHGDEPANSAYAYLVAAADAMSGARPGARREQTEGFSTRLEDLERLGARYKGVEHCAAVHGGRELRIYVNDRRVSDLQAVEMSSDIATQVSDELTFPGQVKVTVIRSSESVAVAY